MEMMEFKIINGEREKRKDREKMGMKEKGSNGIRMERMGKKEEANLYRGIKAHEIPFFFF